MSASRGSSPVFSLVVSTSDGTMTIEDGHRAASRSIQLQIPRATTPSAVGPTSTRRSEHPTTVVEALGRSLEYQTVYMINNGATECGEAGRPPPPPFALVSRLLKALKFLIGRLRLSATLLWGNMRGSRA